MSALSIGKAWDEAKAALIANRRLMVPIALGMILLPAVISSMVEPQVPPGVQPPAGPWMLVVFAMIVVMIIGELAMVLLVNGWRGSVGDALGKAARRAPILIIAALIFTVPIVILFLVALIAGGAAAAGPDFDWGSVSPTGKLLLTACTLLVLYVSVRLLPLLAVVASEASGPISSLTRSFALTRGHFWRLLGFLLLIAIAFLAVAFAVGSVVGGLVSAVSGPPEPWSLGLLVIALAGGLVQAGFVLVYVAMLARVYGQLTEPMASVPEVSREG